MRILSRVCAIFKDRNGNEIHRITRNDLMVMHDAPDAIRQDPLFNLLVADRSLEVIPEGNKKKEKQLENDPTAGIDASGKSADIPETSAEKEAESGDAGAEAEGEGSTKAKGGSKSKK